MKIKRSIPTGFSLIISFILLSILSATVHADTITVCTSGCDYTSIQTAIDNAADGDTIIIGAGTYTENLSITKNLNLYGAGIDSTIVDGNQANRVLSVGSGNRVTLTSMTLTDGRSPAGTYGGGIYNSGDLTLDNVSVDNNLVFSNSTTGGFCFGGGIYNLGVITMSNSLVTNNTVTKVPGSGGSMSGGGIYNLSGSTIKMDNCIVSQNQATTNNTGSSGGSAVAAGILNGGVMTITNSAIISNTTQSNGGTVAMSDGGGVYNSGKLAMSNCTVSGNRAIRTSGSGGWIRGGGLSNGGELTALHCTITNNEILATISPESAQGGGVYSSNSGPVFTATNTIIADNVAPLGPDCYMPSSPVMAMVSGGYNLVGIKDACDFTPTVGDQSGTGVAPLNPVLGPLQGNGGDTPTHALLTGSPAIEQIAAGINGCTPGVSTDQRGAVRADGANRGGSACDIGAFEFASAQTPAAVELKHLTTGRWTSKHYLVLLSIMSTAGIVAPILLERYHRRLRRHHIA